MHPANPHESATPPASGGVSYYPARSQGTYSSVRAALASIGCTGAHADHYLTNAQIERSDVVAAPVLLADGPGPGAGDEPDFMALIRRTPDGCAELLIGLLGEARGTEDEAQAVAAECEREYPGRWYVGIWVQPMSPLQ